MNESFISTEDYDSGESGEDYGYAESGSFSGSGSDYSVDNQSQHRNVVEINYSCHYHGEADEFFLLLQLNFWVMFILPLLVSDNKFSMLRRIRFCIKIQ